MGGGWQVSSLSNKNQSCPLIKLQIHNLEFCFNSGFQQRSKRKILKEFSSSEKESKLFVLFSKGFAFTLNKVFHFQSRCLPRREPIILGKNYSLIFCIEDLQLTPEKVS